MPKRKRLKSGQLWRAKGHRLVWELDSFIDDDVILRKELDRGWLRDSKIISRKKLLSNYEKVS